jgi:hypothetical protein
MSRRRSRKSKRKAMTAIVVATVALVILGGFATMGGYLYFTQRPTDPQTGCPTDHIDSVTAVLVDLTDPISPTQGAALTNALTALRDAVPKYGRLEIYPLQATTQHTIQPLFSACNPGSSKDVDSRIYGNPELADRIWQKQFGQKLDAVISRLTSAEETDASPIFEGIQSVAVTAFGSPSAQGASDKKLVIVSDMIQHSGDLSMYKTVPKFETFKTSQYYMRVKPLLRGANVDIDLIVRETRKDVQKPELYKFWVSYLGASDGFLQNWEPMQ